MNIGVGAPCFVRIGMHMCVDWRIQYERVHSLQIASTAITCYSGARMHQSRFDLPVKKTRTQWHTGKSYGLHVQRHTKMLVENIIPTFGWMK